MYLLKKPAEAGFFSSVEVQTTHHFIWPHTMTLALNKSDRSQAIVSIKRYLREHMEGQIGKVTAKALLDFFVSEIGPSLYNQGVADAQESLQARVAQLDFEVYATEFADWR